jgi:hypothetical protein
MAHYIASTISFQPSNIQSSKKKTKLKPTRVHMNISSLQKIMKDNLPTKE